jgi:putative N-acetyltransferase (TIGR04045 family)
MRRLFGARQLRGLNMPLLSEPLPVAAFFMPGEYGIQQTRTKFERAACFALRREIFCHEQKIFEMDDRDSIDDHCILLAASSILFGHPDEVVGTVRIHQPEPTLWWGSRLAVAKPHRRISGLGAALIKLAVGTAKFHGAETFLAHVQAQNLDLFRSLHWRVLDQKSIHGRPHYLMAADLDAYDEIDGAALRILPGVVK